MKRFALGLLTWGLLLPPAPAPTAAEAARITVHAGGAYAVPVTSLRDGRFRTTVPQRYDFSCGAAAAATLLTYHYEHPTTEQQAFEAMFAQGDRQKIRRHGFSLFDVKQFLAAEGFTADGFRAPLDRLREARVPAIVLVDDGGYRHFVVVKCVDRERVLLGDPAKGLVAMPRARFEAMWGGVLFLIRNQRDLGARHFNDPREWGMIPAAPVDLAVERGRVGGLALLQPLAADF
ncbi:MAG: C39 family peptidase [Deferrisomatales bacterium]